MNQEIVFYDVRIKMVKNHEKKHTLIDDNRVLLNRKACSPKTAKKDSMKI